MNKKTSFIIAVVACALLAASFLFTGGAKWGGTDDVVVKRIAEDYGKTNVGPTIPLEGDLLLFAFLMAGIAGGFLFGYYYRQLFGTTPPNKGPKDV